MGIIIDLLILAIIIIAVLISARRGFVRTAIEVVGFIAAIILTFSISTPLANSVYDRFIEPSIVSAAENTASNDTSDTVNSVWEALPRFITDNAENFGLSKEGINEKITSKSSEGVVQAATIASQTIAKPIVAKILSLIVSTLLIIILIFVVRILAKLINKLFSFSLIGNMNRTLGGVIGLFKGIIIATVFCMMISLIVSFTENGFLIFTHEAISNSYFFTFLSSVLPMM